MDGVVALMLVSSLVLLPKGAIAAPTSLQLDIEAMHQQNFAAAVRHLNQSLSEISSVPGARKFSNRSIPIVQSR